MPRSVVLAVAGLWITTAAAAAEAPIAELASAPFASVARTDVPNLVAEARAAPATRLVWLDPTGAALGTEGVVRLEVTRLLREMGVGVSWRRAEPNEIARPGELRVIFLNRTAERGHQLPVLGATPSSFLGEPFVWVHVPSVRAAAGIPPERVRPSLDIHSARSLGIALARVIAHEVVHAVAPAQPHGTGLMSARLDRRMLTAARIAIDPQVSFAVRAALGSAPPAPRPAASILAAQSTYKEPYR